MSYNAKAEAEANSISSYSYYSSFGGNNIPGLVKLLSHPGNSHLCRRSPCAVNSLVLMGIDLC